jgi:alkanesulfonate monooxygenase SsuD/methylene tetrahydromethanopterin reductase-like flavin-dependent oxidoreductase (luciferase family)
MEVGLVLMGHEGSWDDARYAESRGFHTAGFVDSPLIVADPFVAMTLAAERTSTLRLGTMLAIPSNRNVATLATAIGTVNRLAPGRTFLGIGSGFTGRAVFGLKPLPVARFSEYVAACRTLLAGGEIIHHDGGQTRPIRRRHVESRYVDCAEVPIYVAADGPRALAVAGQFGDGWITSLQFSNVMGNSDAVFADSLALVRGAASDADRSIDSAYTMAAAGFCVLEDGEAPTSERALEHVGPYAMLGFHAYADNPAIADHLPPPMQERLGIYRERVLDRFDVPGDRLYQEVHRGHLSHLLDGEAAVLTDEIVRMTTLTGSAQEIAAVLRRLEARGLRNVTLNPPPHLVRQQVDEYADKIAPLLRQSASSA